MEVKGRRGRRRKQLLGDFKEKIRYWKLKEEELHLTVWRACLEGPMKLALRQIGGGKIRKNRVDSESKFRNFNSTVLHFGSVPFSCPYRSVSVAMSGNIN